MNFLFILCLGIPILFPKDPIAVDPIASPRSPSIGMTATNEGYEGSLGVNVPIIQLNAGKVYFQLGAEAGTWFTLTHEQNTFPLQSQDFLISFPLSFRYKGFSAVAKYNHISAHLGDGNNKEAFTYSRDYVSNIFSYDFVAGLTYGKMYVSYGYAHKMFPVHLGRWFATNGFEIYLPASPFIPYCAYDMAWNQDVKSVDYSFQSGAILFPRSFFNLRLAILGYIGSDRRGQFYNQKIKRIGIGIFFIW